MNLQLVVLHYDDNYTYYPLDRRRGWRVDSRSRCLVIGHGVPRTYVPLDQVRSFTIEHIQVEDAAVSAPGGSREIRAEAVQEWLASGISNGATDGEDQGDD